MKLNKLIERLQVLQAEGEGNREVAVEKESFGTELISTVRSATVRLVQGEGRLAPSKFTIILRGSE